MITYQLTSFLRRWKLKWTGFLFFQIIVQNISFSVSLFCLYSGLHVTAPYTNIMASPTQWPWVWANSGTQWRTGRPGVLPFMGRRSQTGLNDWTTITMSVQYWYNDGGIEWIKQGVYVCVWLLKLNIVFARFLYVVIFGCIHPITLMCSIPFF